jgi:hypothetical protein
LVRDLFHGLAVLAMSRQKKSAFARKQQRKLGSGTRDPKWAWWAEKMPADGALPPPPRAIERGASPGPTSHLNSEPGFFEKLMGRSPEHRKQAARDRRRAQRTVGAAT